ncbi:hypothetical protein M5K25_023149 [Dendrobium thyrsiflorum]|uniref:Sodium channel modifier 1 zinc-finger domain-containing protein n=1 Tax=Dendrobium thyrsiflorum TaxID=117978 RepID=A0ABD0U7B9_DENTH
MSVFGGDSWAREAHHRKRRLDDLLLSSTSSSSTGASFYKRLSNGKFACLVCPHKPVLDSPLILSQFSHWFSSVLGRKRLISSISYQIGIRASIRDHWRLNF